LTATASQIDFECEVDWRHRHYMLKVEFPVLVKSEEARYEIQFGHVKRPTHFNTSYDVARFESCGHKWIDLSQPDYGVALFTDCKYGYAVHGSVMRISLLRASAYPDPEADQGKHEFKFACYPHANDFIEAEVVRRAFEFNSPLLLTEGNERAESWFSIDSPHLVIDTIKKAEDSNSIIVRLYEAHGVNGKAILSSSLKFKSARRVNLMEEAAGTLPFKNGQTSFEFRPFEIISIELS
jgi:alpha-mannosidase